MPNGYAWPEAIVIAWQTPAAQAPPSHEWPQRPQLLASLWGSTQLPPQIVLVQVHVPLAQLGVGSAHGLLEDHVPSLWQVSTACPAHCVCEGAQTPLQSPLTHVWFVQATGASHCPVSSQVSA